MATTKQNIGMSSRPNEFQSSQTQGKQNGGIVDDFMYGTNVASAHIYIRMEGVSLLLPEIHSEHLLATAAVPLNAFGRSLPVMDRLVRKLIIDASFIMMTLQRLTIHESTPKIKCLGMYRHLFSAFFATGFMRKVYGILTAQIVVTTLVAALFMMHEGLQQYVQQNHWMMTLSLFGTMGLIFGLMWKRHEYPTNYILLAAFTLMEAYCVGVIVTFYKVPSVVQAFTLTLGIFVGLTLYTLQSKKDFTSWHAPAVMALYSLLVVSFMQILIPMPALHLAVSVAGAALFCVFIVVDTHLLMARLSPEEYILAAINLYLDILNLFLYILRILGERK